MKKVIRFFNLIIIAICAVAGVFMFTKPVMTFKSRVSLKVANFAKFLPENEYTAGIDAPKALGADSIYLSLNFDLDGNAIKEINNGDKDKINQYLINQNIEGILGELHEPIEIITEIGVRGMISKLVKEQIVTQIDNARESYSGAASTTEEIMDETGVNDQYFYEFSKELYYAADATGASVDSVCDVLNSQIDLALERAAESGYIDTSTFTESAKAVIKENVINALDQMNLVNADNSITPISEMPYIYIIKYYKEALISGGVSPEDAEQLDGESNRDYSDRLLALYVTTQLPPMFYQVVGYVALALYISQFVFAIIWGILLLITLIRTFYSKPWTIFGPWFWILGFLQVVMGIGMLVFGKMILPTLSIPIQNFPVTDLIFSLRTCFLIPSIMYLVCIVVAFIYGFFKRAAKRSEKPKRPDKIVVKG